MVATTGMRNKRSMGPGAIPLSKTVGVYGAGLGDSRWSGESLVPSDGYSSLFSSGLMREPGSPGSPMAACNPFRPASRRVTPPSVPKRESIPIVSADSVFSPQPITANAPAKDQDAGSITPTASDKKPKETSPAHEASSSTQALKTSRRSRYRRSSAHGSASSPHKSPTKDVVQALDGVMKSLSAFALPSARRAQRDTFIPNNQSRWSSSTEGSSITEASSCRPRKSGESIRSRMTVKSIKSVRSKRSLRSLGGLRNRKSEVDVEYAPPNWDADAPPVPPAPVQVPQTPGKGKRAMMGLARRLGLTPKKKQAPPPMPPAPAPPLPQEVPSAAPAPAPAQHSLRLPLPLPRTPSSRSIPRKGSFSTLRSFGKRLSSGTLRSNKGDDAAVPPVPSAVPSCVPVTPRRMPKSSIGPPKYVPETSPGKFMREAPRRAPATPKQDVDANGDKEDIGEIITFGSPGPAPDLSIDASGDMSAVSAATTTAIMTPDTSFQPDEHSTPTSLRVVASHTPLTAKSAVIKPKRLLNLLPRQQQRNLGLSPVHTGRMLIQSASIPNLRGGLPTPGGHDFPPSLGHPLAFLANENTAHAPLTRLSTATGGGGAQPRGRKSTAPLKASKSQEWYTSRPMPDGPFGNSFPLATSLRRRPVPDFSAPPPAHADAHLHSRSGSPESGTRTSQASEPSMLGTLESGEEGWEFQQFLRDYEDPEVCVGIALVR